MVVKPLDLHPEALEEWKSAVAWYLDRNETAAVNFVAEVDRAVDLIAASPHRWPVGLHGTRKFVLQRFPFAIVYRKRETDVQVLAVTWSQTAGILEGPTSIAEINGELLHLPPHTGSCSCIHPGASIFASAVKSITRRSSTIRLLTGLDRRARSAFATRRIDRVKSRRDL